MAGNVTTYDSISPRTTAYAAVGMLKRGQFDMVVERYGQAKPIPKKHTKSITFRRTNSIPNATAALAEGIPPAGHKMTVTDVTATLEQYGDFTTITDVILDTHEDNVLQEAVETCGEQIAETKEVIRIAVLKAGTNVYYQNNVSGRSTVNGPPTRSDFRRIYRALKKNKARSITKINKASVKVSTEPVAAGYIVMGSTDLDADIRQMDGFIPSEQYSNSDKAQLGEIGKVDHFRFVLTPLFEPWNAAGVSGQTYLSGGEIVTSDAPCDVYPMIVVAKDAYGLVPLQGQNAVKPAIVNPKPQVGDELGQKGFVSWKMLDATIILQQNWLARLEVGATAIPS